MCRSRLPRNSRRGLPQFGAIVTAAMLLAACAAPSPSDPSATPRDDKVYRTGSNLPTRDPTATDAKAVDPGTIQRTTPGMGSPTTGRGG